MQDVDDEACETSLHLSSPSDGIPASEGGKASTVSNSGQTEVLPIDVSDVRQKIVPVWSEGAALHAAGDCRPCCYFWKANGCVQGPACTFCHMCDLQAVKQLKKKRLAAHKLITSKALQKLEADSAANESAHHSPADGDDRGPELSPEETGGPEFMFAHFHHPDLHLLKPAELHSVGQCRPCAWFFNADLGCSKGKSCQFCHVGPHKKPTKAERKKVKIARLAAKQVSENGAADAGDASIPSAISDPACRTVMIKNIPYKVHEAQMLALVTEKGFGTHEYFTLPELEGCWGKKNAGKNHAGYGFIGFSSNAEVLEFAKAFTGYSWPEGSSRSVLEVAPAKFHGSLKGKNSMESLARKRSREEATRNAEENGEGSGRSDGEDSEDSDKVAKASPKQKRRRFNKDEPLSHDELAALDFDGCSMPSWLLELEQSDGHPCRKWSSLHNGAPPAQESPVVPAGWEQMHDPASGKPYYSNPATGETSWTLPSCGGVALASGQPHYAPHPAQESPVVPEDWEQLHDPASGKPYYSNPATGETSWTLPSSGGAAPAAGQPHDAPQSVAPMPRDWETIIDPSSGRPYYRNCATGQTSWTLPE